MKKKKLYAFYTISFWIMVLLCFSWFISGNRSLIWGGDGWNQQFRALVFYSDHLKGIIQSLIFEHRIVVPEWNFYIGEGNDILNSLHYYAIGDPISLLSVFIPTAYMHYFFSFSQVLRLFLAGLAFVYLCTETEVGNSYGIVAGALSYSFCSWGITYACDHPSFVNPMIYFPLMIIGVEKLIRQKKPIFFIMITALSAACNFYFFYMIALLTAVYSVARIIICKKSIKDILDPITSIALSAVTGVCISAVIVLPVFIMLMNDSRVANKLPLRLLYPLYYYTELPAILMTNKSDYSLQLGLSASVIVSLVYIIIKKRQETLLKTLALICAMIILLPLGGRLMNGMSYTTNRWSWAFALLCCYILAHIWEDIISLNNKQWLGLLAGTGITVLLSLVLEKSRTKETVSAVIMILAVILVLRFVNERFKETVLFAVTLLSIFSVSFWQFSPIGANYVAKCVPNNEVWVKWNDVVAEYIKTLSDSVYPRYSGREMTENVNLNSGISNTQYYWSMSNPYVNEFRSDLAMREQKMYSYQGYDDRTTPTELASVRYFAVDKEMSAGMPYGYSLISAVDNYEIYENQNALSLGYCYDSYIDDEQWENLDPVQRQEIELETALVEGKNPKDLPVYDGNVRDYSVPFEVDYQNDGLIWTSDGFITTEKDCVFIISVPGEADNSETYIGFDDIEFRPVPEYDLYFGDESVDPLNRFNEDDWKSKTRDEKTSILKEKIYWNPVQDPDFTIDVPGVRKIIHYQQPDAAYSSGRHDYIANIGYSEENVPQIKITVPLRGVYKFSALKVYRVPMDDYTERTDLIRMNGLRDVSIGNDEVIGNISAHENSILCMAIPYSSGWSSYVDGVKTELLRINKRYIGTTIPVGEHRVEFKYDRPFQKAGNIITIISIVVLFLLVRKSCESK